MRRTIGIALIIFLLGAPAFSQTAPEKYWIKFTDKNNSPYSVDNPSEFLSLRSLNRRSAQGISVIEQDIPVNQTYIDGVLALGNIELLLRSKWLNAITVHLTDTTLINQILALPYVNQVKSANKYIKEKYKTPVNLGRTKDLDTNAYGPSFNQLAMLNGDKLHAQGYLGEGMLIFVCDGGFNGLDTLDAFDHLFETGRIIGTHDFVDGDDNVYESSTHGTSVMGTMAGILPNQLIGTAPGASYYLAITEDVSSEFVIEEDNWISGAELADSLGADIITTSLSYTTFNNPQMDHTYADMNGQTTRVAIGAGIAATKGMLIVVSAGNYFQQPWHYIGSPADAFNILAIGAVKSDSLHSSFSSAGPSFDGRVKPEIVAQGTQAISVATNNSGIAQVSGTSFSGPIIAGISSCLWQAIPEATSLQVRKAIIASANQYNNPDDELGYGIPNYGKALLFLNEMVHGKIDSTQLEKNKIFLDAYPIPVSNNLTLIMYSYSENNENGSLLLYDVNGKLVTRFSVNLIGRVSNNIVIPMGQFSAGYYTFQYQGESGTDIVRIVKY